MQLDIVKPSKQTRITMALRAVTTVDAMNGEYRATTSPDEKQRWMMLVWNDPQVQAWCGQVKSPDITYIRGTGTYRFGRAKNNNDLIMWFGTKPMSDCDLASAFGYSARYNGWPHGSRQALGIVHDPEMTMLTIIALWVHSPARAKELHHMYGELNIPVAVPVGGWDPTSWGVK